MKTLELGPYVDSALGIYMTDAIVGFARAHGATIQHAPGCDHADTAFSSEFGGCPWVGEYEDLADAYMTDHHPVEGAYWGRSEIGDWGLWPVEEEL